ncbi:MAG TPA: mechanosensitive ion channel family protein [Solirubrobacteraceae bacterium]|jgi:small-conductance mechanosensitive channel|nr:mechanosensitive ion channel family protein [Solirubrobacteraceae bacterium]
MFDTHSHEWEAAGLPQTHVNDQVISKARRQAVFLLILLGGVLALNDVFGTYTTRGSVKGIPGLVTVSRTWVHILAAFAIALLGWAFARDVGRAAAPTFFRRMDPSTAGTVGFILRLATVAITVLGALAILKVPLATLAFGGSITAIVLGLAAQQTLGNLFAGMVLLSARPFRVGMRVRLQAGQLGGPIDGVVSSLGLLYTQLARGQDVVLIPNNVVLSSVVVPIREPDPVDVRVRLHSGISATTTQGILDENIKTPTRREPRVILQEIDGDNVVVRIQATPERAADGAKLADEIISAIATVTGEHEVQPAAR